MGVGHNAVVHYQSSCSETFEASITRSLHHLQLVSEPTAQRSRTPTIFTCLHGSRNCIIGARVTFGDLDDFRSLAFVNSCNINLSGEPRTTEPLPPAAGIRILNSTHSWPLFRTVQLTTLACIMERGELNSAVRQRLRAGGLFCLNGY